MYACELSGGVRHSIGVAPFWFPKSYNASGPGFIVKTAAPIPKYIGNTAHMVTVMFSMSRDSWAGAVMCVGRVLSVYADVNADRASNDGGMSIGMTVSHSDFVARFDNIINA